MFRRQNKLAPKGFAAQAANFLLNLAVAVETTLSPEALLALTQSIENALGRVRHERWGARTIDIDVLCFEGVGRNTPELTLPHPYMTERAFVLVPLAEIAPVLSVKGKTVEAWRDATGSEGVTCVTENEQQKKEPQSLS